MQSTVTDPKFEIVLSDTIQRIDDAKQLFMEYAKSLDFSLCFQGFDVELAGLPGEYSPLSGRLVLAFWEGKLAGCVSLRRISKIPFAGGNDICEMKRLYLRSEFRGKGIGRKMASEAIRMAKQIGYAKMRLDTVPTMKEAISLYHTLGFVEIDPYRDNPVPGAIFMELALK